jgi:hypothetical protein
MDRIIGRINEERIVHGVRKKSDTDIRSENCSQIVQNNSFGGKQNSFRGFFKLIAREAVSLSGTNRSQIEDQNAFLLRFDHERMKAYSRGKCVWIATIVYAHVHVR